MTLFPGATEHLTAGDGTPLAVRTWSGGEPFLFLAHANGFSKEIWGPTLAELRRRGLGPAGAALDQRGHGDSGTVTPPLNLAFLGSDVAHTLRALRRKGTTGASTIGVGHSSGGTAIAMAALADDSPFDHLVLVEPIIFPPPFERRETIPIAQITLRRRSMFPDRAAAIDYFRGRGPFALWSDEAIDAYVDGAMRSTDGKLVLKCDPVIEADAYRAGFALDTWSHLDAIGCPVTLVVGADSTTHRGSYLDDLVGRFREVELRVVPSASHFVPMERPDTVADAIIEAMSQHRTDR